jgi:hypothetical protein
MSVRIVVHAPTVREIPYVRKTGPKAGQNDVMRKQEAYAFLLDQDGKEKPYPEKIELDIRAGQAAYAAGEYTLHPSSFWVGSYGALNCSPRLVALKQRQPAAA